MTVIIGIDPGLCNTGWAMVEYSGSKFTYLNHGMISTDSKQDIFSRLRYIFDSMSWAIKDVIIDVVGIEDVFVSKNVKTSINLGEARCAAMLAVQASKYVYIAPREVKKLICGSGSADKEQVYFMVKKLLNIQMKLTEHESEALAIAIASYNHTKWYKL